MLKIETLVRFCFLGKDGIIAKGFSLLNSYGYLYFPPLHVFVGIFLIFLFFACVLLTLSLFPSLHLFPTVWELPCPQMLLSFHFAKQRSSLSKAHLQNKH